MSCLRTMKKMQVRSKTVNKLYLVNLIMGMWTKAKLEEAIDLRSVVLGGASPSMPTNF